MPNFEGYCVKCREKRQFDGNEVELANGRRAAQGTCPTCGTKMNRILGKKGRHSVHERCGTGRRAWPSVDLLQRRSIASSRAPSRRPHSLTTKWSTPRFTAKVSRMA